MLTNPKENRNQSTLVLIEEFRRKGYQCREIQQEQATIIYLTHERKPTQHESEVFSQATHESFKNFLRFN